MIQIAVKKNDEMKLINLDDILDNLNIPEIRGCSAREDNRCELCDRHISELKPYGGKGDPLEDDFTGEYFVIRPRPIVRCSKEYKNPLEGPFMCVNGTNLDSVRTFLTNKYGKKEAETIGICWASKYSSVSDNLTYRK